MWLNYSHIRTGHWTVWRDIFKLKSDPEKTGKDLKPGEGQKGECLDRCIINEAKVTLPGQFFFLFFRRLK